jgi:UDP-N-acetylglucosamine--N-acetylmuramyl-(pentapeptide) pyrophosphoryl-undecaprenol N-acetylglucosamine transferase
VERAFVGAYGMKYRWIFAGKLRRYFDLRNAIDLFAIAFGFLQSLWMVMVLQPSVVVVSGAYVQVPFVWAARLLRIPVVVHQLDVTVGLANRISARGARTVTATFEESAQSFGNRDVKVVGNPARQLMASLADPIERARAAASAGRRWALREGVPVILVAGGGTGASTLNERIVRIAPALIDHCSIIHLTGKGKMVRPAAPGHVPVAFMFDELREAVAVSTLAVTRAGMGMLTELGVVGMPMLLVPLAGQQEANARYLAQKGAALILDIGATDQVWIDTIRALLHDRDRQLELSRNVTAIFPADAAERLATIILELAAVTPPTSP